jgi:hypothetical protein
MIRLLEPWFLAPGVLAAAVVTALHFVVRSPVRRAPLPTVRFLSPAPHTSVRLRRRPHDLLLLALRVLFALSLAAAFARPVWTANVADRAGILLLDRGAGMAGAWNSALDSVSVRLGSEPLTVIVFDTAAIAATPAQVDSEWINEMRDAGTSDAESDYRIAFHALAREAGGIAAHAYEAALVTVPRWTAWREGTTSVRAAAWPGRLEVIVPTSTAPASEPPPPTRVFTQQESALFDAVEALGMTAVTDAANASIRIVGPDSVGSSEAYGWQFVPDTSAADDAVVFPGGWSVAAPRAGAFTRSGMTGALDMSARTGGEVARGVAIAAWRDGALAAMAIGESPCTITTAFDPDDDALTMSPDYPELIRHLVSGCTSERASLAAVRLDSGAMRTLRGSGDAIVQAADLPLPPAGRPLGTPLLLLALFCAVAEWVVRRRFQPSHSPVGTGV